MNGMKPPSALASLIECRSGGCRPNIVVLAIIMVGHVERICARVPVETFHTSPPARRVRISSLGLSGPERICDPQGAGKRDRHERRAEGASRKS
jgi:hypothetical protein